MQKQNLILNTTSTTTFWPFPQEEGEWVPQAHSFMGKNIFDVKQYIQKKFPKANVQYLIPGGYPQTHPYTILLYHEVGNPIIIRPPEYRNIPFSYSKN